MPKSDTIIQFVEVEAPYVPLWVPVSLGILIACQLAAIIYISIPTSNRLYYRSRGKAAEQALIKQEEQDSVFWKEHQRSYRYGK